MTEVESPVAGVRVHVPTVLKIATSKWCQIVDKLVQENAELTAVLQQTMVERDDVAAKLKALTGE